MIETKQTDSEFNSAKLFLFLLKKSKLIFICCVFAIILSVVFSSAYFIPPMFKSTIIFYPAANSSISQSVLSNADEIDMLAFGAEEETEQLLQILKSSVIRDLMIEEFNLLEHYEIASNEKYKKTKVYRKFSENFEFKRTEFMAVEVNVFDQDAQIAADMANKIGVFLDETKTRIHQQRALLAFDLVDDEYNNLKAEVKIKEDSLSFLRQKGVYEYSAQVEMINQQLAIELGSGNKAGVTRLEKQLAILAKYGSAHINLTESLQYDLEQLNYLKIRYKRAKIDAEASLTHKFIVDYAYKAEKKAYPVRWLIVMLSTVSVFMFTIIVLLAIDNLKKRD